MSEHILFLTGQLAERQLTRVLEEMAPEEFTWQVHEMGLKVAALMTADMIRRRLTDTSGAHRIIVPGRCRGDLEPLTHHFGIPVQRGPEELKDLPRYFGRQDRMPDLSVYDVRIFAEIVDAPRLSVQTIVERAAELRAEGADVIDLGCLPDTPFGHLAEAVRSLKDAGFLASVDSMQTEELLTGGRAGADFLLSLHEGNLWIADEVEATPVLVPRVPGDLSSLRRAIDQMRDRGRPFIADPILDPIHFGFSDSIVRYHRLRQEYASVEIMMGVGNLTELTEADTTGINALLMGLISEIGIANILPTQVSPHCRTAVREADLARRIMYWARQQSSLPKHVNDGLTGLHELDPFPYDPEEIRDFATDVRDPNFRIQISAEGIHVYNRDGLLTFEDPFDFFEHLAVEADGSHAFYLGIELARAQIARQLGKRYVQDQPLRWGCAVPPDASDTDAYKVPGPRLKHRRKRT